MGKTLRGTNQTYTPTTSSGGIFEYYCVVFFSLGGCGSVSSDIITITINPDPSITTQPLIYDILCDNGAIATPLDVVTTGGSGIASYIWKELPNGNQVGTSQTFDIFWMINNDKRFRCFKGEFFYHKANWKKFHKWCYIEDDRIMTNDAVVISLPFSDYGKEHPKMKDMLDVCEELGVPVLIDCAYYVIARDINFDFTVEISKTSFSQILCAHDTLRAGLRVS